MGWTFSSLSLVKQEWGGYWPDFANSVQTGSIAFTVIIEINDDISDNIGNVSISEASFMNDGVISIELVELVLKQIKDLN